MRWSQASLLSQPSVLSTCPEASYAVVVDKSTAVAIACGDDVELSFESNGDREKTSSQLVHPVCMLAIHLALVAVPGCRWIALSYSSDRFPFLHSHSCSEESVPSELLDKGYPDPARYWRLVSKEAVDALEEQNDRTAHRPRISYWLYVLERTNGSLQPW